MEQADGQTFRVDTRRRFRLALRSSAVVIGVLFAAYAGLRLATGGPLFVASDLAFLLAPVLYFGRTRWGDRVVVGEARASIYRGGTLRHQIPFSDLTRARAGPKRITLVWKTAGKSKRIDLFPEGFSSDSWSRLCRALDRPRP